MSPLVPTALLSIAAISAPAAASPFAERPVPVQDHWAMGKPSSPGEKAWWCITNPGQCLGSSPKPKGKSAALPPPPPPVSSGPPIPGAQDEACRPGPYILYFDFDRSDISAEAAVLIDQSVTELARCGSVRISVAGHTDEPGSREYNIALSERRAIRVKDYLVAKGVAAERIETMAYGEERPRVVSDTYGKEPQNRRAEITFIVPE